MGGNFQTNPRVIFRAAMDLDILIFIHPLGFSDARRMTEHYLNNIIGNPLESTLALSHLIFWRCAGQIPWTENLRRSWRRLPASLLGTHGSCVSRP